MAGVRRMRQQDIDFMLANYESTSVEDCAKQLDVSARTVARWANELGLHKRRGAQTTKQDHQLRRKDCIVKKCCLVCEHWKNCDIASSIDGFNAVKLLCWDFELNNDLRIE